MLVVFFKQESAYELRISDWSSDVCSSDLYDIPICTNYGATEFAGAIAGWTIDDFRKHWTEKRGAVGRVHANIAARVVDPATGAALPAGEERAEGRSVGNEGVSTCRDSGSPVHSQKNKYFTYDQSYK